MHVSEYSDHSLNLPRLSCYCRIVTHAKTKDFQPAENGQMDYFYGIFEVRQALVTICIDFMNKNNPLKKIFRPKFKICVFELHIKLPPIWITQF